MQRLLLNNLLTWKQRTHRKPLLIDGARQTGKTYLLEVLLGQTFANVIRLDFLEKPELEDAFSGSLSPNDIISNIELFTNQRFKPETDLLILDVIIVLIGKSEKARNWFAIRGFYFDYDFQEEYNKVIDDL